MTSSYATQDPVIAVGLKFLTFSITSHNFSPEGNKPFFLK